MKRTTTCPCVLAIVCCLTVRTACAQGQENAGQEQTVAFMRITDQDAAASRLLGRGLDARAYLAFRKTERLCEAFLKRYPKGEYAVDVGAILRFSREELDQLGMSGDVQRELRQAALEKVPEFLVPVRPPRVAMGPVTNLLELRLLPLAGGSPARLTTVEIAGALRAVDAPSPAPAPRELRVPSLLGLRPCTPVVVGTTTGEWCPWLELPACMPAGAASPFGSPDRYLDTIRQYGWDLLASAQRMLGGNGRRGEPERAEALSSLLSSIRCIGLPSVGSSLRYPGTSGALDDLTALAGPPASGDLRVPGLLATQPLSATSDRASLPGASRLASAFGAMNASSTAPVSVDLGTPGLLVLRALPIVVVRAASLAGSQLPSASQGLNAWATTPASQSLNVPVLLSTRTFVSVAQSSISPASSPTPVSDDLYVPGRLTLRPFPDVPLRTASRGRSQRVLDLEGVDALAGPPAVGDLRVPDLLATRSLPAAGEGAPPSAACRAALALGALNASSPAPVPGSLHVPDVLSLRRLPSVLVSTVSEGWLPWPTLPACVSGEARPLSGKQDACPTSAAAAALRALSASSPTVVSVDLPVTDSVALSVFPPVAAGTGSRGGSQITNALKGLEASSAAPASRDLDAPGLLGTQPFAPVAERAAPPAAPRVASALRSVRALSPRPASMDLRAPGLLDVQPSPRVAARSARSNGPSAASALKGLAASIVVPASPDLPVPDRLDTRPFVSIGASAAVPVASALEALSVSSPTPVSDDLDVPDILGLRSLPPAAVNTVSSEWLTWRDLPACVSGEARPFLGKQDAHLTSRIASAIGALAAPTTTAVSADLRLPQLLEFRLSRPAVARVVSPPDSRLASALAGLEASATASAVPDRPAPGLSDVGLFQPARVVALSAAPRIAHGLDLATRPSSVLSRTEPLGDRALDGAPALLSVERGGGDGAPVDGQAMAFETAVSRRLAGAYHGLGKFFDDVGDVETGALMYREAVVLGPDGARHFRLACRALARAYRKRRDWPGLEWLASTLEAWAGSEPWAQELAGRIRPRRP